MNPSSTITGNYSDWGINNANICISLVIDLVRLPARLSHNDHKLKSSLATLLLADQPKDH